MSRFAKKNVEETEDYQGNSKGLYSSGLFEDVEIVACWLNKSPDSKSESLGLLLAKDGKQEIVFSALKITNNDGSTNEIGQGSIHQLCIAAGLEDGINSLDEEPNDTMEVAIGKKGAMQEVQVFSQLCGITVSYVKINNYYEYNSNIMQGVNFTVWYENETKRSAGEYAESLKGEDVEFGRKYAKDVEYYGDIEDATDYGEFTPKQIKAWAKAKYPKGTAGTAKVTKTATSGSNRFKKAQ